VDALVDFYAGAIAMFAVVLFTKFVTHHVRHNGKSVKSPKCSGWYWAHWVCVFAAWVGLLASLAILGHVHLPNGWYDGRDRWWFGRWIVFGAAFISGTILAFDVALTGRDIGEFIIGRGLRKIWGGLRRFLPGCEKNPNIWRDLRKFRFGKKNLNTSGGPSENAAA
jgi:hypothetical protein